MAWLRIDDRFTEHRKIVALRRGDRFTWVELLCYCARHGSAHVPEGITDVLKAVTPGFIQQCVKVGLLDENGDGYHVHDWDVYNPKDPLKADRMARYRAKKRGDVDDDVDERVDADQERAASTQTSTVTGPPRGHARSGRTAARARPVPTPREVSTAPTEVQAAAAAERLTTAGWTTAQLDAASTDLERADAWLTHCRADPTSTNPAGLAWTKFLTGAWPEQPRSEIAPGAAGTRSTRQRGDHICRHCDLDFPTEARLAEHTENVHPDTPPATPPLAEFQALGLTKPEEPT